MLEAAVRSLTMGGVGVAREGSKASFSGYVPMQ